MDNNSSEMMLLPMQGGFGVMVVYGLELLKKLSWVPWVNVNSLKVNRSIAWVMATLTTLGVHYSVTGSFVDGWHINLVIPPLFSIVEIIARIFAQVGGQDMLYHIVVKDKEQGVFFNNIENG